MSKKNVILILADQMRGDCLGANGNNKVMTPFMDQLAIEGLNFQNAHSSNPSCIAARASILTGLPSEKNGFFGYCDGIKWDYQDTLVDELNNRGYKTINVGKTHFYPQRNSMNFDVNKLYDPQKIDQGFKSDYHQWLEVVNPNAEDPALEFENNSWAVFEWAEKSYFHPTEWTLRTALEELNKVENQPFFLQLSFHRPHPPLDPPNFYKSLYSNVDLGSPVVGDWSKHHEKTTTVLNGLYGKIDDRYYRIMKEAYYASITHVDYQVGRLMEYLRINKLKNDTLIIFTSDHGEMLGDHYMFRKATPFKGAVHIPMFIYGPEIKSGVNNKLVTHIDLKPTILNYVDQLSNNTLDGIDMLSAETREVLYGEHPFDRGWHFLISNRYKYIWDSCSGDEWCFDLAIDLDETKNIFLQLDESERNKLRKILVENFKERGLEQFIEGEQLKTGDKLQAFYKG